MEFHDVVFIGLMLIIIVLAGLVVILQEKINQRDGYCSRIMREANEWQKKYLLERAKNRRPEHGQG
jgi:hypothetical protein